MHLGHSSVTRKNLVEDSDGKSEKGTYRNARDAHVG